MFVEAQDEFDYDEAVEALQRVFGIVGICPMVIEENKDMEHLTETVIKFIDEQYPVKDFTFKVHARRGDKQFPLDSMAINMEIGGQLLDAFEGISRCAPSTGNGEYRSEKIYLYLFSGNQRTRWNASWNQWKSDAFIIRRNRQSSCRIYDRKTWSTSMQHISMHHHTQARAKQKVIDLAKIVAKYAGPINFTCCKLYRHSVSDL